MPQGLALASTAVGLIGVCAVHVMPRPIERSSSSTLGPD
jgi:hypothetical protein